MIVEYRISKNELRNLIAVRVWEKEQKNVDTKDVHFKCDYDQTLEYAYVNLDLGE